MRKIYVSTAIALIAAFSATANDYRKVASVDEITDGYYLIACPTKSKVMGAVANGSFPAVTVPDLTVDTEEISGSDEYAVVRITPIPDANYFIFTIDGKFLTRENGLTLSDNLAFTALSDANFRIYPGSETTTGNFMIYNSGTQAFSTANRANNTSQFAVSCLDIFKDAAAPEPAVRPILANGDDDILLSVGNLAEGTIADDGLLWTSDTEPAFTLALDGEGRMEVVDGGVFRIACGNQFDQHATVTVGSADADYYVSAFVFEAAGFMGDPVVVNCGDLTFVTRNDAQYGELTGIAEGTDATFTLTTAVAGHSKKPVISNFDVILSPVTESSITGINADAATATEWYNMQGMRVAAPVKGQVYIRVSAAGVEKVLVR